MYPAQTVVALETRGVWLTWTEAENPANVWISYRVYRKTKNGFKEITKNAITDTKFFTDELPVGRTHFFIVQTIDEYGNSSDSEEFSIFIP